MSSQGESQPSQLPPDAGGDEPMVPGAVVQDDLIDEAGKKATVTDDARRFAEQAERVENFFAEIKASTTPGPGHRPVLPDAPPPGEHVPAGDNPAESSNPVTLPARRFAGLDGLRALAVLAVICYHGLPGLPNAGFVGVDVFFVLSGFLITSLIVDQFERHSFSLTRFWDRRLRRIAPAVVVLVLGVVIVAVWMQHDTIYGLRRQVLGAFTFSFNWLDVASSSSYFNEFQPELFRNLWSLAVEMQFYLVWPLLLIPLVRWLPRAATVIVIAAGASVSVYLMTLFYAPDGDPTRVYFGTDTHAFGLLIGAGLACWLAGARWWRMRGAKAVGPVANRLLAVAGLASLAGIIALVVALDDTQAVVYPWGLLSVAGLAGVAVMAASANGSWFGRLLDVGPLRWVGERSYGVYLWHWPLGVIATAWVPISWFGGDQWRELYTMLASLGLSVVVAAASYRWIETPIRKDGWAALWQRWKVTTKTARRYLARGAVLVVTLLGVISLTVGLVLAPAKPESQILVEQGGENLSVRDHLLPPPVQGPPVPIDQPPPVPPMPQGDQILAIGDSVMLGCAQVLKTAFPGISVDAQVSRSFIRGLSILQTMKQQNKLRPVIIVGLMTNGPVSQTQLDRLLGVVGPDVTIVLVNGHAARSWIKPTNKNAASFASAHPESVLLADWDAAIKPHPKWLASDGVHPNQNGREVYLETILQALHQKYR